MNTPHERDPLTTLDYRGARYYDSDIGRFLSVDPLAADYAAWSSYNYVMGNPVLLTDPTGRNPVCENCDEQYNVGSTVSNQYGSWEYLGENNWKNLSSGATQSASELSNGFREMGYARTMGRISDNYYGNSSGFSMTSSSNDLSPFNVMQNSLNGAGLIGTAAASAANNLIKTQSQSALYTDKYYWLNKSKLLDLPYNPKLTLVSKIGKGVSFGSGLLSTGVSFYNIQTGNATMLDYSDFVVGLTGVVTSSATYFTGAKVPVVGQFVMLYGAARLSIDIGWYAGQRVGPSTWFGTDDNKYFK